MVRQGMATGDVGPPFSREKPALEALLADRNVPALDSFEPGGYEIDLNELFETGLRYFLDGIQLAR